MSDHHLPNDEFLTRLTTLLHQTHSTSHGSVFLSQKPLAESTAAIAPEILIRATNGLSKEHRAAKKKIKLSTLVDATDLASFYMKYAEVCKKGMEGLRKRDKKKGKAKKKAKAKGGK